MSFLTTMIHRRSLGLRACCGVALTVVLITGGIGCSGPTKAGREARADARERLDVVNSRITFDQARQSFEVGQFDRGLREIESAIARYPDEPDFHILRGRILLELNRLDQAILSFEQAADLNDALAKPHYFIGIIYQRWSQLEAARDAYHTAFKLDSTHAPYLTATIESMIALAQHDDAEQLLRDNRDFFEHNVAMRVLEGQIAMLRGDSLRAATLLQEARMMNPDDMVLLDELAYVQFEAGLYGQCLQSVRERQATMREPRADLMHLEARCLAHMERDSEARNIYIKLSYIKDNDPDLWAELGVLAWGMGDYMRVAQCASRLLALAPDRYEGHLLRGIQARQNGEHGAALRHFWDAAERAPERSMPYVLLGHTFEHLGQHEEAYLAYRNALQADPENREAGMLLSRLNQVRQQNRAITSVSPGSVDPR